MMFYCHRKWKYVSEADALNGQKTTAVLSMAEQSFSYKSNVEVTCIRDF